MEPREFASMRNEVVRRPGLDGPGRRAALTDATDAWLQELFAKAQESTAQPMCLVAVGGYGRRELTIGSDLDLVLLHGGDDAEAARAADLLWYPVWDSGVTLDHSVRTTEEARRVAGDDVRAMLGMLDLRVVAGDEELASRVSADVLADWRASAERRLADLHVMVTERRARFGELGQMVEPNLKESYGGLRDSTVLAGISASWITDVPHTGWEESVGFLLDVRESLHRLTGSSGDVLLMQEQAAIARDLVGVDDPDALLRAVYDGARAVAYASDVAWHRVERIVAGRRRRSLRSLGRRGPIRLPLADGVVMQEGEAVLALEARPAEDPGLALRAAAAAAQAGVLLSPHTVERLAAEGEEPPVPWTREMRESFVSLLGSGAGLPSVWEALDQAGLVGRWLPAWQVVRSAPQRNALHRHTVDRHLVEAAVQAGALTRNVDRPDLLLVAALLHDIGKARGGDHSLIGARIAEEQCAGMGFPAHDVAVVEALVRLHLVLPDTATRRDLDDVAVIDEVARAVGSVEVLDLLHQLTIADSIATGPAVCSDWRFGLIDDLVTRVRGALDGRRLPEPPGLTENQRTALEHDGVWVLMEVEEETVRVTVAARDQLGLLGTVAGVLALNRLHVLGARVMTVDGRAVQEWTVRPAFGDPPSASSLSDDIRRAIEGTYDVADRLARREADYALAPPPGGYPAPLVEVIAQPGSDTTVVEVRAHDVPGLLFRLGRAVAAADVDIVGAKVDTLGSDAVDVFFVRTPDGRPLGPDRQAALRVTVLSALA
jgi:[protein-PII] uridylyltransferase